MNRRGLTASLVCAMLFIAACAHKTGARGINDTQNDVQGVPINDSWVGRISLQIQSEPPQSFFTGFELKGNAASGELALISPLGSILGIMRWTATDATLDQGGNVRRFTSTNELLEQVTGAAVPITALFDWLKGINSSAPGWVADLSQQADGRIIVKRISPAPPANLRIVLEK